MSDCHVNIGDIVEVTSDGPLIWQRRAGKVVDLSSTKRTAHVEFDRRTHAAFDVEQLRVTRVAKKPASPQKQKTERHFGVAVGDRIRLKSPSIDYGDEWVVIEASPARVCATERSGQRRMAVTLASHFSQGWTVTVVEAVDGSAVDGAMPMCEECWGTGLKKGWGAPCGKGCGSKRLLKDC